MSLPEISDLLQEKRDLGEKEDRSTDETSRLLAIDSEIIVKCALIWEMIFKDQTMLKQGFDSI